MKPSFNYLVIFMLVCFFCPSVILYVLALCSHLVSEVWEPTLMIIGILLSISLCIFLINTFVGLDAKEEQIKKYVQKKLENTNNKSKG